MRRLVMHPYDVTTQFLDAIYQGYIESSDTTIVTSEMSNCAVRDAIINHSEIYLLGHGTEYGLLSRFRHDWFDRLIVNAEHVQFLRERTVVGIWCNANIFAEHYGLHGLFSGMVISEIDEALDCGVETTVEEIAVENRKFAERLAHCLHHYPLCEIPERMRELDDVHSQLTLFNYNSLYFFE